MKVNPDPSFTHEGLLWRSLPQRRQAPHRIRIATYSTHANKGRICTQRLRNVPATPYGVDGATFFNLTLADAPEGQQNREKRRRAASPARGDNFNGLRKNGILDRDN
jgi:hypothetical protein